MIRVTLLTLLGCVRSVKVVSAPSISDDTDVGLYTLYFNHSWSVPRTVDVPNRVINGVSSGLTSPITSKRSSLLAASWYVINPQAIVLLFNKIKVTLYFVILLFFTSFFSSSHYYLHSARRGSTLCLLSFFRQYVFRVLNSLS